MSLALLHSPAHAQTALSAALDSDYRVRGLSYSNGRPTLSFSLAYDHPTGVYAGATLIGLDTRHSGVETLGYVAYLGYARRLGRDQSIDFGLSNSRVSVYLDRRYSANYTEIYAGGSFHNLTAHVYYSPHYIGEDSATLYWDVDGAIHPMRQWRLFAHAGILTPLTDGDAHSTGRTRADFSAGVARRFKRFEAHLQWSIVTPRSYYPEYYRQRASAVTVGIAAFF